MNKIFYAQNRRSGGDYLRRFLENEYKDKCFIGLPKSQKDIDFILSDNCLCFCTHIQVGEMYPENIKQVYNSLFNEYRKRSTYKITIIRHPVKRFYSGIQRQVGMLNNPANNSNHGRFSGLSRIYGPYTKDFVHKNLNPSEFNLAPFNIILREILSKSNPDKIEDNENTMWLYESLFTMSLGDKSVMEDCLKDKEAILNTPISILPQSIQKIIEKNFSLVGVQENNNTYLKKLIDDGILSKQTVEEYSEIFPKINTTTPIRDEIDEMLLYEWYKKFPYDFVFWSWAIKYSVK